MTVHHSRSRYQMQDVFSRHLGMPEHKVRVITPDIGGGFGLKITSMARNWPSPRSPNCSASR